MAIDPHDCGIYSITAPSGNQYIGSSKSIKNRWSQHKSELKKNKHANAALQNAWNKYEGQLEFKKLLVCEIKDLLFYEQLLLDNFKPEYNICPTAGNTLGYKASEETKLKLSIINTGRKHSEESKEKIRKAHLGRIRTPEHCIKIGDSKRGQKWGPASEERKSKISAANRLRWAERKAKQIA